MPSAGTATIITIFVIKSSYLLFIIGNMATIWHNVESGGIKMRFTILLTLLICPLFINSANAESYEDCRRKVHSDYAFSSGSLQEEYKEIEDKVLNEWLEEVWPRDNIGRCGVITYKCSKGQKNRDCVPDACWVDFVKLRAFNKFVEVKCGKAPDNKEKSNEDTELKSKSAVSESTKTDAREKKLAECAAKNPPMDVKQNIFGKWVCTDSQETIDKREKEKASNKNLKDFWNDMDAAERALNDRVKQLSKK